VISRLVPAATSFGDDSIVLALLHAPMQPPRHRSHHITPRRHQFVKTRLPASRWRPASYWLL